MFKQMYFLTQFLHATFVQMCETTALVFFFTHSAEPRHIYELRMAKQEKGEWAPASIMQRLKKKKKKNRYPIPAVLGSSYQSTEALNEGETVCHKDVYCERAESEDCRFHFRFIKVAYFPVPVCENWHQLKTNKQKANKLNKK